MGEETREQSFGTSESDGEKKRGWNGQQMSRAILFFFGSRFVLWRPLDAEQSQVVTLRLAIVVVVDDRLKTGPIAVVRQNCVSQGGEYGCSRRRNSTQRTQQPGPDHPDYTTMAGPKLEQGAPA